MSDEAMKLLDDLDWAEKVVRRKSTEAKEAQVALTEAMNERAKASRAVAAMIKANHSSAISWNGGTYVLREGDVVERIPTVIVHDCAVPKPPPVCPYGELVLRLWLPYAETHCYAGIRKGRELCVYRKVDAVRFASIEQAEQFKADRPRWSDYEVAGLDDRAGPPIDAEVEEPSAEQIAEAVNGRDLSDAEIDADAAAYAAVEKVFGEAHGLGSDEAAS
jgi:hypothetical protein